MTGSLIQEILEAELDNELGYSKWDYRNKNTTNSRNGYSEKALKSSQGEIERAFFMSVACRKPANLAVETDLVSLPHVTLNEQALGVLKPHWSR